MVVSKPQDFEHEVVDNHATIHSLFSWPEVNKKQTLEKIQLFSNGKKVKVKIEMLANFYFD